MKYIIALIVVLSLSFPVCYAGDANETTVSLTVNVINGTENGTVVAGDEVTVQIYGHDQLLKTLDGVIDADNRTVFSNIPVSERLMAIARVKHQGMMFSGHPAAITPKADNSKAEVYVYDVSYDNTYLSVTTHHMVIETDPDGLKITEYLQLKNASDMAVTSKQLDSENRPVVLEMTLPKGFRNFKNISYFEENALVLTSGGFYDTMAIGPGEYSAAFSYALDINKSAMNIAKQISLPTSDFVIFVEVNGTSVEGLGEPENTVSRSGGIPMTYYKVSGLTGGDEVAFVIKGFNVSEGKLPVEIILVTVFAVVVIFVILRLRTNRK